MSRAVNFKDLRNKPLDIFVVLFPTFKSHWSRNSNDRTILNYSYSISMPNMTETLNNYNNLYMHWWFWRTDAWIYYYNHLQTWIKGRKLFYADETNLKIV